MFHQGRILYTSLVSLIMTLICLDPCQWSLMSLITGNQVKKNKRTIKSYGSAARLDQAIVIKA